VNEKLKIIKKSVEKYLAWEFEGVPEVSNSIKISVQIDSGAIVDWGMEKLYKGAHCPDQPVWTVGDILKLALYDRHEFQDFLNALYDECEEIKREVMLK
jgi:hypothetical protein